MHAPGVPACMHAVDMTSDAQAHLTAEQPWQPCRARLPCTAGLAAVALACGGGSTGTWARAGAASHWCTVFGDQKCSCTPRLQWNAVAA